MDETYNKRKEVLAECLASIDSRKEKLRQPKINLVPESAEAAFPVGRERTS